MHDSCGARQWAFCVTTPVILSVVSANLAAQVTIDVDIPARPITGTFTINGEEPPASAYENANIFLRNPRTGDQVHLGATMDGYYLRTVMPGTYDIHYKKVLGGLIVPRNENRVIGSVNIPDPSEVIFTHDIDIPVVTLSGTFTFNGDPLNSAYERGWILAVDRQTGDEIRLGDTATGFSDILLVPGHYGLYYEHLAGGVVPRNERAFLRNIRLNASTHLANLQVPVPEPSSYALAMLSVLGLGVYSRGRRNARATEPHRHDNG